MFRALSAFLLAAFLLACMFALDGAVPAAAAREDFAVWLEGLRAEALSRGISSETLDAALSGVEPIARVIELDRSQPEFTLSFDQYMARMVGPARVLEGREKLAENRALLDAIGARYGVPPRFVVALWGIETSYGRHLGSFPVIASLATLAYDGRRVDYFRKELLDALEILDEKHIAPEAMIGSWAGAMGQSQFMPSSFLRFAVDYDGDGRADIWNDTADVLASAANYLAQSGWKRGETWGREVVVPDGFDPTLAGLEQSRDLSEWQALGVRRYDGGDLPEEPVSASLIMPEGIAGPAFLVYDNFRTILTWNRSQLFGIAVGWLADRIAAD